MSDWEDSPAEGGWEEASEPLKKVSPPPSTSKEIKPRVANPRAFEPRSKNAIEEVATYDKGWEYGTLLPYRKNTKTGAVEWAAPAIVKDIAGAVAAPSMAVRGELDPNAPEAVVPAINLAGTLQLGTLTKALKAGKPIFNEPTPAVFKSNRPATPVAPKAVVEVAKPPQAVVEVARPAAMQVWEDAPITTVADNLPVQQPKQAAAPITVPMAAEEVAGAIRTEAPRAEPINLKQFDTDKAVSGLVETTIGKMEPEQIMSAKRGVISFEQAQSMADATGYGADFFLKNKTGVAYNAEQIQRFKDVVDSSSTELAALANKALETRNPQDMMDFKKSQLVHSALISKFIGASSEAGRTLNQLKAMSQSMDNAKFLDTAINRLGKDGSVEDLAMLISKAEKDGNLKQMLAKGSEFAWSDVFFEAWKAGLLSGVKTQVKNLVSNTSTNMLSIPERMLSAGIGSVRSAITGSKDKVTFKEVQGMVEGYTDMPSAFSNFKQALKNEDYLLEGGGKADIFEKAITAENFRKNGFTLPPGSKRESFVDNTGKVIRIPFRVLNATDVGFKSIAAQQQLRAIAYRDAVNKKLTGEEFNTYVTKRINSPSKAEMNAAMDWAHYVTFTKELGKFGKSLQGAAHQHPLAHMLFPFINTPVNLAKYFVERTPLQLMSKKTRQAIKGGGAEADMALGKMAAGTAMIWGLGELVEDDIVSMPYSVDKPQAGAEYAAGYRPFAIKTKDGYIPIDTIDPVGSMVVTAASLKALTRFSENEMKDLPMQEQTRKLFAYTLDTFNNVFIDKTYMSGFSDALDAASGKEGFDKWAQSMAKSTLPTIFRDVNSVMDNTRYSPRTTPEELTGSVFADAGKGTLRGMDEAIKAASPFDSKEGLRMKLDMWGDPATNKTASMVNPFKPSPLTDNPLTLLRLKYGINVPRPESETSKLGIDLSEDDKYKWQYLQGQYAKQLMGNAYENSELFKMRGDSKELDKAKATVLQQLNESAARLATQIVGVEATLRQRDDIKEELNKKLFPKPKRPDIVK